MPRCISVELRQGTAVLGSAAVEHDVLLNADPEGVCLLIHDCLCTYT
jgi:hypothetical protein